MLSGLLGIGGGILMVPAFSAWVGLPLKETIATSLACVGIFAVPGTITHAFQGDINWSFAVALAIGVIPGAQIGARIHDRQRRPDAALHGRHRARDHRGDLRGRRDRRALLSSAARTNTASSISGVSLPVNVFCWLGWNAPRIVTRPHGTSRRCVKRGRRAGSTTSDDWIVRSIDHTDS